MPGAKKSLKLFDSRFSGGRVGQAKLALFDWMWKRSADKARLEFLRGNLCVLPCGPEVPDAAYFRSLCDRFGSDKASSTSELSGHVYPWLPHDYCRLYPYLFQGRRHQVTRVFELGLGTNDTSKAANMGATGMPGASLRVWRDFFPSADIWGADIDSKILFVEERIKTEWVDQTSASAVNQMWSKIGVSDFDLMVDDGLHTFESSLTFLRGSVDRLRPTWGGEGSMKGGYYVIEDVPEPDLTRWYRLFQSGFLSKNPLDASIWIFAPSGANRFMNTAIVIQSLLT